MYWDGDNWILEPSDQCFTCKVLTLCPLVNALCEEVVWTDEPFDVTNCDLYLEKERHLTIVRDKNG